MDPQGDRARSAPSFTGKGAYAISQTYYYAASVVGVGFLLGGSIAAAMGLRAMVFHTEQQLTHAALRSALDGLAFIATGGAVAFWHLRQARARAGFSVEEVFWGDALYSHLVALLALIVGMVGSVMVLLDLASIAAPVCVSGGTLAGGYGTFCLSSTKADAIGIVDGLIILAIAGGVWLWHVRRGRAIMRPASAA